MSKNVEVGSKGHIYFSGIGGSGIGPLALLAHRAGYKVSGSDQKRTSVIAHLEAQGIQHVHIGQSYNQISSIHQKSPIDWFVHTSALKMDQPDAPELKFCQDKQIKTTKRDEFLAHFLKTNHLKLIAIAGTHGKTTTTAMAVWLAKQMELKASYLLPATTSFGAMAEYSKGDEYFIYEADEFDRNFLAFEPFLSLITGIDWDHKDIYPTFESYKQAFGQFLNQSQTTFIWKNDAETLKVSHSRTLFELNNNDPEIGKQLTLSGRVNRLDAWLVANAFYKFTNKPIKQLLDSMNRFPGLSRRFEAIAPNLYSDYAHTPPKIRGALQTAKEVAGSKPLTVVYEGLHNTRQHHIKGELKHLFDDANELYIVPSYLAREDQKLPILAPSDIKNLLSATAQQHAHSASLGKALKSNIQRHLDNGALVLCISAGSGDSLDEWLRREFKP